MCAARASTRYLPDGSPLHNRLLAALPPTDYARVVTHLRLKRVVTGDTLQANGSRRTFQQVADGPLLSMAVARFIEETDASGPFREVIGV
jgi:hypothetical protein